ncbi:glycosyltransferase family 25 protein [Verrucomicrobiaceae bacterium 227]
MATLPQHFDRIVVISLPERSDRRARLIQNLGDCHLATSDDLTWLDAVDGHKAERPSWWQSGAGAWGCRFSQLKALQEAQRDGLENVLILEDDAIFHRRTNEWLEEIMPILPDDWGQLFLGGQHMQPSEKTDQPKLILGRCITRTHAYAVHRRLFQTLIDLIQDDTDYQANPGRHVDHQFAEQQLKGTWKTYAPAWWFAGQDEGLSDIADAVSFPQRWWQEGSYYWQLPFIKTSGEQKHQTKIYIPGEAPPLKRIELILWLRTVAREAWERGLLPSCPATIDLPEKLWPGGFKPADTTPAEISRLADFPANGLFAHPFSQQAN